MDTNLSSIFSAFLIGIALFAVMPAWLTIGVPEREKLNAFVVGLFAPSFIFIVLYLTVNLFAFMAFRDIIALERTDLWFVVYLYAVLGVYHFFPQIQRLGKKLSKCKN